MFARIGSWQGKPAEIDQWVARGRDFVKPSLEQGSGLKAAYWLVDRENGKAMVVTLWESEEAMLADEEARVKRQSTMAAFTGARVMTTRFEVVDSLVR